MERNLICIICPKGCMLKVNGEGSGLTVSGNTCPKGEKYAIDELTAPKRTVTSIVKIGNRENTMVSVKTENPIPKENIFDLMAIIRQKTIDAPIGIGDIIIENIFGTNIIATKDIK